MQKGGSLARKASYSTPISQHKLLIEIPVLSKNILCKYKLYAKDLDISQLDFILKLKMQHIVILPLIVSRESVKTTSI